MKILYIEKDGNKYHWYLFSKTLAEMNKIKLWNGETSILEYDHNKALELAQKLEAKLVEEFNLTNS